MTPEERQKLKEKELAHLRELQRLKRLARHAKRQNRLNRALSNITGALDQVTDESDSILPELELENARIQARMDLALEEHSGIAKTQESAETPATRPSARPMTAKPSRQEPVAKTIGSQLRTPPSEAEQDPE